jgi:hypothetical protein
MINTRYRDGEFVKCKIEKHKLLYVIPSKIYDDNDYKRYDDIYFLRVILEHETAYIIDELLDKVYWLGKKENDKFIHPLPYNERYHRTDTYKESNKRRWLKQKTRMATDPEFKEYRKVLGKKTIAKKAKLEETDPIHIEKKRKRLEELNKNGKKGGIYYEQKMINKEKARRKKAAIKRASKKYYKNNKEKINAKARKKNEEEKILLDKKINI